MIGDKNTKALLYQPPDYLLNILDCNGVDSCKGLIKQYKAGFIHQGAGYFHPATLAAGKRVRLALAQVYYI